MERTLSEKGTFADPERSFERIDPETAARMIRVAVDVALIVDGEGIIQDLAFGSPDEVHDQYRSWLGSAWVDTVTVESRAKVEALLEEAARGDEPRSREVNHCAPGAPDLPVVTAKLVM